MEMGWRLEIFEDQGTPHEAEIEKFKKRLRLRRLKKLLAKADSSNSQKGKNSRRNQCPLDLPPAPNSLGIGGRLGGGTLARAGQFDFTKIKNPRGINMPWIPCCPQLCCVVCCVLCVVCCAVFFCVCVFFCVFFFWCLLWAMVPGLQTDNLC